MKAIYLLAQLKVFDAAATGRSAAEGIETAATYVQRMAQLLHGELLGKLFNGGVL